MAVDKEKIALWVAGVLASAAVAFLIYNLERKNAAQTQQNAIDASNEAESELANQQSEAASLPQISVPSLAPSPTDVSNQATAPANNSELDTFLAALLAGDNSSITSQSSPSGNLVIPPLIPVSKQSIPAVNIPSVENFSASTSTSFTPTSTVAPQAPTTGATATPIKVNVHSDSLPSGMMA